MTFIRLLSFLIAFTILIPNLHAQDATGAPESLDAESAESAVEEETETAEVSNNDVSMQEEDDGGVLTLEEAQALIYERPAANDAIGGGEVPLSDLGIYNIYARQLAYRESAKKFRASLEARRVSFEEPRTAVVEEHREIVDKVYEAESAAFQKSLEEGDDSKEKPRMIEQRQEQAKQENVEKMDMAKTDMSDNDTSESLKEMPVPSDDETVRRKVVTDPEAPDFDPSKL